MGKKLQRAVFFLYWFFPILLWCVVLCTYPLRNTRCEITLQVGKHFSVSDSGSPLFKVLYGKAIRKPTMGEWISIAASVGLHDSWRKSSIQSPNCTGNSAVRVAVGTELTLQARTCLFHKESNFQLYPVARLFSSYEKGHLLPKHHPWSWIVSDKKGK